MESICTSQKKLTAHKLNAMKILFTATSFLLLTKIAVAQTTEVNHRTGGDSVRPIRVIDHRITTPISAA